MANRPLRSLTAALLLAVATGLTGAGRADAQAPAARASTPPPGPIGLWIDHTGRGAVEIAPCASELCGKIVWLKDPLDKSGKPLVDSQNSDRAKRGQPICGLQIIGGLKQQPDGSWDAGWIYDPEEGDSFDVELRLLSPGTLQVKGYKGLKFLSETFKWQRAETPPGPRCA